MNESQADSAAGAPSAGKRYTGDTIDVTFDGARCIHAAECMRGLPAVFDTQRRPWILPAADATDAANGGSALPEHAELAIKLRANGPLKLTGEFELIGAWGQGSYRGSETALCRCGGSANKPFCDGAHRNNGFVN